MANLLEILCVIRTFYKGGRCMQIRINPVTGVCDIGITHLGDPENRDIEGFHFHKVVSREKALEEINKHADCFKSVKYIQADRTSVGLSYCKSGIRYYINDELISEDFPKSKADKVRSTMEIA